MAAISSVALRSAAAHKLKGFIPSFADQAPHQPLFDTLTATTDDLQKELIKGTIKSTQIVEEYHRSILAHNGVLNAVYELASGAMQRAREMDELRASGKFLGPFHGIPILIKDNMNIDRAIGLGTTGGALALEDAIPSSSATIVERLLAAGVVILGKATMSEMAFFKGRNIRCGWSAVAGHAQSAYVRGGLDMDDGIVGHSSPSGSSSGSAIAVSAGLAAIALGSETFGSLVGPAQRAALFTVKPTLGIVPGYGILPISKSYDIAGPIGKSPKDVADLLTVLVDPSKTTVPEGGYASALEGEWKNIKVGTLDPEFWFMNSYVVKPVEEATKQINEETRAVYAKIEGLAKSYHGNISQMSAEDEFKFEGDDALSQILAFDMEEDLDSYLKDLTSSRVRSLKELVAWNFEHAKEALTAEYPNQDLLVMALEADHDLKRREKLQAHIESVGAKFAELFTKYDVDVIMAPSDSGLYKFSAAGGFPIATLPISCLEFNGRPFGLTIAVPPHQEAMLFKVMNAWEATFPPRQPPKAFLSLKRLD